MIVYVHEVRGQASVGATVVGPRGGIRYRAATVQDALEFIDAQPGMELGGIQPMLDEQLVPEGPETFQQRVRRLVQERLQEAS